MTDISRLVLTRKAYQSIKIGDLITITVEEIRGKTVRISVEAPRGIPVHRREIYERILGAGADDEGATGVLVPAGPSDGPDRSPGRRGALAAPRGRAATSGRDPGEMCGGPL